MNAATLILTTVVATGAAPLALHPENPRLFQFRGRPTVLITSAEHYGAVLNADFDHRAYLAELEKHGFNQTRAFSGTYREVPGSFRIRNNTLAPAPERALTPWARRDGKYDLDQFDEAYFDRLRDFLGEAGRRGVVVEYVLFCPFYEEALWEINPMNARNNVNGVGAVPREEVYTLRHQGLLDRQLAFVRRVVIALNEFDNLYYEICNEPYFGGVTPEWQHRVAETIVETERALKNTHLIAQNIANKRAKVERPHPAISVFNFHYASPPDAVAMNWDLNKPIVFDETGFRGTGDAIYRQEAWQFLLAGGAGFSHLDYSFTVERPDGTSRVEPPTPGGGGPEFRKQLAVLRRFLDGFDLVRMRPDAAVVEIVGANLKGNVLHEPGRQYAIYLHGEPPSDGGASMGLKLPRGRYDATWINPVDGEVVRTAKLRVDRDQERLVVTAPPFTEEIALRIVVEGFRKGPAAAPR